MKLKDPRAIIAITSALALALVVGKASAQVAPSPAPSSTTTTVTTTTDVPATSDVETATTPNEHPVILSPFQVNSDSNVGYGATRTTSSARVAQNYIDVPQTVNVFTSEFINDFNLQDERELFNYVPNLVLAQNDVPGGNQIRGETIALSYVDGVQTSIGTYAMPMQFYDRVEIVKGPTSAAFGIGEPAGIINFVSKTPTGADATTLTVGVGDYNNYLGNIDTQGHLTNLPNLTYRLAAFWDTGDSQIHGADHSGYGAQLSLRYDLNPNANIQLITSYAAVTIPAGPEDSTIWQNETVYTAWVDTQGAAGSPKTLLPGSNPVPAIPPGWPGGTTAAWAGGKLIGWDAEPLPDGWQGSTNQVFRANLAYDQSLFNNHVHVRNTLVAENMLLNSYIEQINGLIVPSPGVYDVEYYRAHNNKTSNFRSYNLDVEADYDFGIFGKYTTLIGGDANALNQLGYSLTLPDENADGTVAVENLYNINFTPPYYPVKTITNSSGVATPAFSYASLHSLLTTEYGVYAQEEASYFHDMLNLSVGWRIDWDTLYTDNEISNVIVNPPSQNTKGAPRFAVTIKPEKWLSFYGLVTEHKDPPQSDAKFYVTQYGDIQPSTIAEYNNFQSMQTYSPTGTLVEGGAKATFFDGAITASFCVFHEISTGQIVLEGAPSVVNPDGSLTVIVQNVVSGSNVHGYEGEIFGQITKRLTFIADYAISRGSYVPYAYNGGFEPNPIDPPTTISGHAKYDFSNHGTGFFATFGGKWYGPYLLNTGEPVYVWYGSSQYEVDGGIGFKWDHGRQRVYLNVDNFTNQHDVVGLVQDYVVAPAEQGFITYTRQF